MRVYMQSIAMGGLLGTGVLLLVLLGDGTGRAEEDCAPLVQNKCGTCHFVNYVCPRIEKGKGSFYWKGTVKDMVQGNQQAWLYLQLYLDGAAGDPVPTRYARYAGAYLDYSA